MKIGFNLEELIVRFAGLIIGVIIERRGYAVTLEFVRKRNGVNLKSRGLYRGWCVLNWENGVVITRAEDKKGFCRKVLLGKNPRYNFLFKKK